MAARIVLVCVQRNSPGSFGLLGFGVFFVNEDGSVDVAHQHHPVGVSVDERVETPALTEVGDAPRGSVAGREATCRAEILAAFDRLQRRHDRVIFAPVEILHEVLAARTATPSTQSAPRSSRACVGRHPSTTPSPTTTSSGSIEAGIGCGQRAGRREFDGVPRVLRLPRRALAAPQDHQPRSSRPSPPCGYAPKSPRAPARAPPSWPWRSS